MQLARRGFLSGIIALAVAPAIVRAGSLMPVKVTGGLDGLAICMLPFPRGSFTPYLMDITRKAFVPRMFVYTYFEFPTTKLLLKNMGDAIAKDIFEHGDGGPGLLAGMKGH